MGHNCDAAQAGSGGGGNQRSLMFSLLLRSVCAAICYPASHLNRWAKRWSNIEVAEFILKRFKENMCCL
jgi:hypothetical protein